METIRTYVAYYRRSTDARKHPEQQKHSIQRQRVAVENMVEAGNIISEFTEMESGRKNDRVELHKAIALCKKTNSTLVIAALSRLSRSARFICELLEGDVPFICCDYPNATTLTLQIMAAVAENQVSETRKAIIQGLAVAKSRGIILGSPTLQTTATPKAAVVNRKRGQDTIKKYLPTILHIRSELLSQGDKPTLSRITQRMNELGIRSPRGGDISMSTVHYIQTKGIQANL